jgi:hypothetical protein
MQTEPNKSKERMSDAQAHASAMSMPIGDVVARLVTLLGATTVAVIGGVSETRAVTQWVDGRTPQRQNVLRFALQVAAMIGGDGETELVRAWFFGSNPHLGDQVPMVMLRDLPLNEISSSLMAAARAFAAR